MSKKRRYRPSFFAMVVSGLVLGILFGLFFGERLGFLAVIGDAYIGLLQMTVIPYVIVSLISGLGRLNYRQAGRILTRFVIVLAVLWSLGLMVILLAPLAYPDWEGASFFSTSLLEQEETTDFLALFIPKNPFYSLANGLVPSIVLFSLAIGAALIAVENKSVMLNWLSTAGDAIMGVTKAVVRLAPFGIFAITADAASSMRVEEFQRLQVFIWIYLAAWVFLIFWALPMLLVALTPVKYREVFRYGRTAMVTCFSTGSLLIVLPLLSEGMRKLLTNHEVDSEESISTVDLLIPTAYTFPSVGLIVTLSFVLFGGWYVGSPLEPSAYLSFSAATIFVGFSGPTIGIPFLLDMFRLPADLFQLYLLSNVLIGRFGLVLAIVHIMAVCLLTVYALEGRLNLRVRNISLYLISTLGLLVLAVTMTGFVLTRLITHEYKQYDEFIDLSLLSDRVSTHVHETPPAPLSAIDQERPRLDIIRERGTLRLGYMPGRLPFAHHNRDVQHAGFDIDMAHTLARDLGVSLEIVPHERAQIAEHLSSGRVDIVMAGLAMTPGLATEVEFTQPYLDGTLAFIVRDHRRHEFAQLSGLKNRSDLRIAVLDIPYFTEKLQEVLPQAELVAVPNFRTFFQEEGEEADAFVYSAEAGSAWTLVYPDFSVVIPEPVFVRIPVAYAVPKNDADFVRFVNVWLELKSRDGTIQNVYDHWILGRGGKSDSPRWSIVHDVLKWVD